MSVIRRREKASQLVEDFEMAILLAQKVHTQSGGGLHLSAITLLQYMRDELALAKRQEEYWKSKSAE